MDALADPIAAICDAPVLAAWRDRRDQGAFARLVAQHGGMVRGVCARVLGDRHPLVDDAAQAVFLVLAMHPEKVGEPQRLAGWLHRCARRAALRAGRDARLRRRREQEAPMPSAETATGSASDTWDEVRPHLDAALDRLTAAERAAVVGFYLEGKPQAVVAAELGCTVPAVKMRLQSALDRLRRLLGRHGMRVGAAGLIAGLASEAQAAATAAPPTILAPALAGPTSTTIAQGVLKAMLMSKLAVFATVAAALAGIALASSLAVAIAAEPAPGPVAAPPPAAAAGVTATLDKEVTLDIQDMDLADVVALLGGMSGATIAIDPTLAGRQSPPITLKVERMKLRHVLDFITRLSGLAHVVRDGRIVIVAAQPAAAQPAVAPTAAESVALAWMKAFLDGEIAGLMTRSTVPFAFDRKESIADTATLRTRFLAALDSKRGRVAKPEYRARTMAGDAALYAKHQFAEGSVLVLLEAPGASDPLLLCLSAGADPKVIGCSD